MECRYCQSVLSLIDLHFEFEKTPAKALQRMVLDNSHVFIEIEDSEESPMGPFIIDAAVMWALEPLWMTMYIYI